MIYCRNCGTQLEDTSKFCQKCGYPTKNENIEYTQRQQEFVGKIYKCPSCGEILKSFQINCPSCGCELRDAKISSAVKEFALKLETIESKREYEKSRGLFAKIENLQRVSKTDEQKISLIKSFSVPNTKEDMFEFMILATSNINMRVYDSTNANISQSQKELNEAWFTKVQQIYEKVRRSYSTDDIFPEIQEIYDRCNNEIKKVKRKSIFKWVLMIGWIPLVWIVIIGSSVISEPKKEMKEIERLENIVFEVQKALENEEYKYALRIADSIDYQRYDIEMERKWDIERKYWIDKVVEEASKKGIELEYILNEDIDKANEKSVDSSSDGGFIEGFKDSLKSSSDKVQ